MTELGVILALTLVFTLTRPNFPVQMQIAHVVKGKQKMTRHVQNKAVKMSFSPLHVRSHPIRIAPYQLPLSFADGGGEPLIKSDFSFIED
mgnify:CR=1 FL=1